MASLRRWLGNASRVQILTLASDAAITYFFRLAAALLAYATQLDASIYLANFALL